MSNFQPAPEGKDPVLWEIAQRRASFKSHLITYIIINAFLWAVWLMSSSSHEISLRHIGWGNFPWPLWATLGWGIGLAFHFAGAYIFPRVNSVESEYEKLKKQKQNQSTN